MKGSMGVLPPIVSKYKGKMKEEVALTMIAPDLAKSKQPTTKRLGESERKLLN